MEQSVCELFNLYLQRSDLRPNSIRFKEKAKQYFVEWFGNKVGTDDNDNPVYDLPVKNVTRGMAEDYRAMLKKEGRKEKTANGYLANFKSFWTWLFENRYIDFNPFKGVRPYRITEEEKQSFSSDELYRLMSYLDEIANKWPYYSRIWRVRICLGLQGMRRGEMLNVIERDIRMSAQHPHILLSPKKKTNITWPWGIKTHTIRMVPLPEVMCFGNGYNVIEVRLHDDIIALASENNHPYLCIERKYYDNVIDWQNDGVDIIKKGCPDDPTGNFQRAFRTLQKNAGINPTKRFHELRAGFITEAIKEVGLDQAANAAGQKNVETARLYDRRTKISLVAKMGQMTKKCYQTIVP